MFDGKLYSLAVINAEESIRRAETAFIRHARLQPTKILTRNVGANGGRSSNSSWWMPQIEIRGLVQSHLSLITVIGEAEFHFVARSVQVCRVFQPLRH
jgi:hypothetical protein